MLVFQLQGYPVFLFIGCLFANIHFVI